MEFRPCIDIHNGRVKQIVGGSLQDQKDEAVENFVSGRNASFYAELYRKYGIRKGHVILLNSRDSEYYEATKAQALDALRAYPGGLQAGGGITPENAAEFLDAGASHVIVTSYVFRDGRIHYDRLSRMADSVGRSRLVLDLSCCRTEKGYYIVTDRWQKITHEPVCLELLERLEDYCDEFLIHAVDVEGKNSGIQRDLVNFLGGWQGKPVTYAGGVHSFQDLELIRQLGNGRVNVTIGSALDLFGGQMPFMQVLEFLKSSQEEKAEEKRG